MSAAQLPEAPDDLLQQQSLQERTVIEAGPSYLHQVWSTPEWRVYRVIDSPSLADNGAIVTDVGAESLTVLAPRAGITTVRFRYTKWYEITSGDACLTRSPDGWMQLRVHTPGSIVARISFTLETAAGGHDSCS